MNNFAHGSVAGRYARGSSRFLRSVTVGICICSIPFVSASGCVGISVVYPDSFELEHRESPKVLEGYFVHRRQLSGREVVESYYFSYRVDEFESVVEQVDEATQRIKYTGGLRWCGVILCAIVPIPLIVPIGRESYTFTLQNEKLVEEGARYSQDHFCGVGPIVSVAGPGRLDAQVWGPYFYREKAPISLRLNFGE